LADDKRISDGHKSRSDLDGSQMTEMHRIEQNDQTFKQKSLASAFRNWHDVEEMSNQMDEQSS